MIGAAVYKFTVLYACIWESSYSNTPNTAPTSLLLFISVLCRGSEPLLCWGSFARHLKVKGAGHSSHQLLWFLTVHPCRDQIAINCSRDVFKALQDRQQGIWSSTSASLPPLPLQRRRVRVDLSSFIHTKCHCPVLHATYSSQLPLPYPLSCHPCLLRHQKLHHAAMHTSTSDSPRFSYGAIEGWRKRASSETSNPFIW